MAFSPKVYLLEGSGSLSNQWGSRYVFCFWLLLISKKIFKYVLVSFLMVGHTHDDIDASFRRCSMKLHEEDFSTIPLLLKSYIDLNNMPMILHMIEEISNFKAFIKLYMLKGGDRLVDQTKTQQFLFYMKNDGVPGMHFKLLCITLNWAPEEGILLWRQDKEGIYLLTDGKPTHCKWGMGRTSSKAYMDLVVQGRHHKTCQGRPWTVDCILGSHSLGLDDT